MEGGVKMIAMILMVMATIYSYNVATAEADPLQDVRVANLKSGTKINGYPFKKNISAKMHGTGTKINGYPSKKNITAKDFYSNGLAKPGNTNNPFGAIVTSGHVQAFPGVNTLGVEMSRIDFAPGGVNLPHHHPRASEELWVIYGELDVGFITTSYVLYSYHLKQGENYVFARGLIHFQKNNGKAPAAGLTAFNCHNPGLEYAAKALFGATSPCLIMCWLRHSKFLRRRLKRSSPSLHV